MHTAGIGQMLEPIQSYCLLKGHPALTVLVVDKSTGLPGTGFVAGAEVTKEFLRVFENDWLAHAAPRGRESHWQPGRSAMESARAWCPDSGVAAIAEHPTGRIAISVEAKADESFDRPVSQVLASIDARLEAGERSGGRLRVESLVAALLPPGTGASDLRYQLLTATAGALAFAHDQGATRAVLIVHEFVSSRTDERRRAANQEDLDRFIAALSNGRYETVPAGSMLGPIEVPGAPLFGARLPLYVGKAVRLTAE